MLKKGVAQNDRIPPEKKMEYGLICLNNIKTSIYRWEIAFNTKCQRIYTSAPTKTVDSWENYPRCALHTCINTARADVNARAS